MGGGASKEEFDDLLRQYEPRFMSMMQAAVKSQQTDTRRHDNERRYHEQAATLARQETFDVEKRMMESNQKLKDEHTRKLQEHNSEISKAHEQHETDLKSASREKDALRDEHRLRENEMHKLNEDKLAKERHEANSKLAKINTNFSKTIEEKDKVILETKDAMHKTVVTIREENEKEKNVLHKEHLQSLNEQTNIHHEQQKLAQEIFEKEISTLRNDAKKRYENMRNDMIKTEQEFKRRMEHQESMTKEEKLAEQQRHDASIKAKDAALELFRRETQTKEEQMIEAHRARHAKDLATMREIENGNIQRQDEMYAQLVDVQQRNLHDRASKDEEMLKRLDRANMMNLRSMEREQIQSQAHQQTMIAIQRAQASENETSRIMLLKTTLFEIVSSTDNRIIDFGLAYADYKRKSTSVEKRKNYESFKKTVGNVNDSVKTLYNTISEILCQIRASTSVLAATRANWTELMQKLSKACFKLTGTSAKMINLTKTEKFTDEDVRKLENEFDEIKNQIFLLPTLTEMTVSQMIMQGQSSIIENHQNHLNALTLTESPSHQLTITSPDYKWSPS